MPRIPDYEAAGTSSPRSTTPRFVDRSETIEQQGQEALLGAVGQVVQQAVEHDDKLRYAEARSILLQEQIAARKELETDNDYETFEKRYTDRLTKARASAATSIRGTRSRDLFELDAQADISRGTEQIRGLARGVEVSQGIARLNGTLERTRTAALEASDEQERIAILQTANDAIDGTLKRRYLNEEQAREVRSKFTTNLAEAYVGIQEPATRIEMLSEPDKSFAKFIAPDRRVALLEAAKKDNDEVRVRAESQAVFDSLMQTYGADFKGALREAREELKADPKLRDATEDRIREEQIAAATFERADSETAAVDLQQFLINGGPGGTPGKYSDAPLELVKRVKPAAQVALKNFSQTGGRTVSDPATLVKLSELASDPQNFADNVELMKYRPLVTTEIFNKYLDLQRQIRTGSVDGKASGFLSINQVRDVKLKEFFGATSSKNKEAQAKINDFVSKFEAAQRTFRDQNGKVKTEDARKILDQLWSEVVISEGIFSDTKKRAYELTDQDVDVPPADRDAIIQALRARGKPVSAESIRRTFEDTRRRELFEKPKAPAP